MNVENKTLISLLSNEVQWLIPIYQREYSWTVKPNCKTFLTDILNKENTQFHHQTGSIIYQKLPSHIGDCDKMYLIDGQQRLTTLSLIYKAMSKIADDNKIIYNGRNLSDRILDYQIYIRDSKDFKLKLTKKDAKNYKAIIEDDTSSIIKNSNMYINYKYFLDRLKNEDITKIFNESLERLFVTHSLIEEGDDPQQIFDSSNTTGLDLKVHESIRNFLFIGLDEETQERFYEDYWEKIKDMKNLDIFIKYYLQLNTGNKISKYIYNEYVDFAKNKDKEFLFKDLFDFCNFYNKIYNNKSSDKKLIPLFKIISDFDIGYYKTLLLYLYKQYHENYLYLEDFIEILKLIIQHKMRRVFYDKSSSRDLMPLTYMYFSDLKQIKETNQELLSKDFLNVLTYRLITLKGNLELPTDKNLLHGMLEKDVYLSKHKKVILEIIENYKSKEKSDTENCTIEHILPQKSTSEWKRDLGENHDNTYNKLHKIGNLTLTGFNSELGNKSFYNKKHDEQSGFQQSNLAMNNYFKNIDKWNEEEINNRTIHLYNDLINKFPFPELEENTMIKYKNLLSKYKISDLTNYEYHKENYNKLVSKMDDENIFHNETINKKHINFDDRFNLDFNQKDIKITFKNISNKIFDDEYFTELWSKTKNDTIKLIDTSFEDVFNIIKYLYKYDNEDEFIENYDY